MITKVLTKSPQYLKPQAKHCCSEPQVITSWIWDSYHRWVISIKKTYVPHHIIVVLYTCNTLCHYHSSISGLWNHLGLPHLMHMTLNSLLLPRHEQNLFYCTTYQSTGFVQFIFNVVDFFYCFWQQICCLFKLCYRLWRKTEICINVGQISFYTFISVLKHVLQYCNKESITPVKSIYYST